jgi:uncharacterized protein YigA (DUF484 family)
VKKQGNQIAITKEASLAAIAWSRLESAAAKAMNGETARLRLFADTAGITAHISDEFGTQVIVKGGKVSVKVAGQDQA